MIQLKTRQQGMAADGLEKAGKRLHPRTAAFIDGLIQIKQLSDQQGENQPDRKNQREQDRRQRQPRRDVRIFKLIR